MRQVPEEYLVREQDILEKEGIYVHSPSRFAKENLFYVQLEALYTCGPLYEVRRKGLASYLLFYIKEGEMLFEYEGRAFVGRAGDVVMLDCRRPHHYKALVRTRFYWFHYDGNASEAYFAHFLDSCGIFFQEFRKMEEHFVLIHDMMRSESPDEGMMSVQVHRILSLLYSSIGRYGSLSDSVARAKLYMDEYYMDKISMEQIAEESHMSQSHFFRLFRLETGMTPYNYLMNVRINHAMKMLLETPYSMEEIADQCAFCSSANFIRAFRQNTGITPSKFRRLISGMTSSI